MARPLKTAGADDHTAAVYAGVYRLLEYVATIRFRVPREDVRPLVHDVFVSYMRNRDRIRDERAWLVAAMYNACRDYRAPRAAESLLFETPAPRDPVMERVDLITVLAQLSGQCRYALHLRFVEGYSIDEVAARLGKTGNNTKQIVRRCLARARSLFTRGSI